VADLAAPIDQLATAQKVLDSAWQATSALWSDAVQRDFERDHLKPLDAQVFATLREMERLAQLVAQARRHVR
jgi:hypothetical protein